MRYFAALLLTCCFLAAPAGAVEFTLPEEESFLTEDGTLQLEWEGSSGDAIFRVERSGSPEFHETRILYDGPDSATFVSGLPEGDHYLRIRENGGSWSDRVLHVRVEFVSRTLVAVLLGAGTLCFLLLVFMLVQGHLTIEKTGTGASGDAGRNKSKQPVHS